MRHTPITPTAAQRLAKQLVRDMKLSDVGQLLVSLCEEIEGELQDGWLTEDDLYAEGSLESSAAFDGAEAFSIYLSGLHHEETVDRERMPDGYAQRWSA